MHVGRTLARLVLPLVGVLILSSSCGGWGHGERLNVLFIIVDTLRADHLGCYGHGDIQTPHIDDLASDGARFITVVTSAPVTAPSVASLVTSTHPNFHGVRDNEFFSLNPELPNLAAVFRRAGYATAGFVGSVVLDRRYGFAEGFDHYDDDMSEEFKIYDETYTPQKDELQGTQRRAEEVTRAALQWLKAHGRQKPFLCFVHYFDPHDPYDPPPPFSDGYPGSPYDGEIAYTDAQIGALLTGIMELELNDRTLVVLTGDHGEGLGEHSERTHGFFLYDSTVLVPLIFHFPPAIPAGSAFASQIRTVDVMPTILELVGLPVPETAQGTSLAPALRGEEELRDREAYVETFHTLYSYNWHELQAIRTPRWKYIRAPGPELYDIQADPLELKNRVRTNSELTSEMEVSLAAMEDRLRVGSGPYAAFRPEHDAEMVEKMRALGYVGGPSRVAMEQPKPGGDYPDPKEKIAELNARQEAGGLLRVAAALMLQGDFEAALERTAAARRVAPGYTEVLATEGLILVRRGNLDEGITLMETAIEKNPRAQMLYQTLNNLGLAYLDRGECDKAIETLKRSLEAKQDYSNAMYNLGLAHERCGHPDEAVRAYDRFLKANPKLDPALLRSVRDRMESLSPARDGRG